MHWSTRLLQWCTRKYSSQNLICVTKSTRNSGENSTNRPMEQYPRLNSKEEEGSVIDQEKRKGVQFIFLSQVYFQVLHLLLRLVERRQRAGLTQPTTNNWRRRRRGPLVNFDRRTHYRPLNGTLTCVIRGHMLPYKVLDKMITPVFCLGYI
jgi:hypothetical protein